MLHGTNNLVGFCGTSGSGDRDRKEEIGVIKRAFTGTWGKDCPAQEKTERCEMPAGRTPAVLFAGS